MQVSEDSKQRYLLRKSQDLEELKIEFEEKNFLKVILLGHQIKGSAATFGFPQMTLMGMELERAGIAKDNKKIKKILKKMESFLNQNKR